MVILNCHSTPKPQTLPSSSSPNSLINFSPPINPAPNYKPIPKITTNDKELKLQQQQKKKLKIRKPSIVEIERAIGAGIFRDTDINNSEGTEKISDSLFDNMLRNSIGKSEGDAEKKLRETGEWLSHQTERTTRSAGKQILVTMFVWILPVWIFAFLFASGTLHLPFHNTFLEDLFS